MQPNWTTIENHAGRKKICQRVRVVAPKQKLTTTDRKGKRNLICHMGQVSGGTCHVSCIIFLSAEMQQLMNHVRVILFPSLGKICAKLYAVLLRK